MKPYNQSNIPLAKKLRKNMTPWERKLWYDYLRYYPVRFQRQKAIGEYIVDFYCAKARLVVALDRSGHYAPKQEEKDAIRTKQLEQMNLTVLRVCNLDIDKNFTGVCEYIDMIVQKSLPQSASLTAPSSEGAFPRETTNKAIYALGFFDGVHKGHQALLKECETLSKHTGSIPCVVTFDTHPQALVRGVAPMLINTPHDRRCLLEQFGMKKVETLHFSEQTRNMPWQDFFRYLTEDLQAAGLVCGNDFRFGRKGEGNANLLQSACKAHGIPCVVVPEQTIDDIRISSTYIRELLESGQMEKAVEFLGHPHILTGTVVSGRKLGRTIGIPTANLIIPEGLVVPAFGVYACKTMIDGKEHLAVTNIGTRPTVGGHRVTVEPWILDFDGDLYGKELTLQFYAFLRPEQKFDSLAQLKAEIEKNAEKTRFILKNS